MNRILLRESELINFIQEIISESNLNDLDESLIIHEDIYGSVEYVSNIDLISEAEYQGRKVQLGKIMKGDVKKSKVYVKNDKGKVVKVNFGDPNMRIKKSNPARRKSFRARHRCDNPGPRWKPRYWACRTW
jgi:translation initiation factor IF-2